MCEGEYESLKEMYQVSPTFVPRPYAWGRYREPQPEVYFLLAEFRDVGGQVGSAHAATKFPSREFPTLFSCLAEVMLVLFSAF